jgi:hypothetical protein
MSTIIVTMEGPGCSVDEEVEVSIDGLTHEEADKVCDGAAEDAFFSLFNYRWRPKDAAGPFKNSKAARS